MGWYNIVFVVWFCCDCRVGVGLVDLVVSCRFGDFFVVGVDIGAGGLTV